MEERWKEFGEEKKIAEMRLYTGSLHALFKFKNFYVAVHLTDDKIVSVMDESGKILYADLYIKEGMKEGVRKLGIELEKGLAAIEEIIKQLKKRGWYGNPYRCN